MENFARGLKVGTAAGQQIGNMANAMHEREVQAKMNDILAAAGQNGGNLGALDPGMVSDVTGLEAMGRVAAALSKTGEAQNRIFSNAMSNAHNQWRMAQQYNSDFNTAVKEGREADAANLLVSMGNSLGIPYRYNYNAREGTIGIAHVTPEGEQSMGEVSLVEAGRIARQYLADQPAFLRNSVMNNMVMAERNAELQAAGPGKWIHGVDQRTGKPVVAIPQYNLNDGSLGYYVQGVGMLRREEFDRLPVAWGRAGRAGYGLGSKKPDTPAEGTINGLYGKKGKLPPMVQKSVEAYAKEMDDATGKAYTNPYKLDVLGVFAINGIAPGDAIRIWNQNAQMLRQANPDISDEEISAAVSQRMMIALQGGGQRQAQPKRQNQTQAPSGKTAAQEAPVNQRNTLSKFDNIVDRAAREGKIPLPWFDFSAYGGLPDE